MQSTFNVILYWAVFIFIIIASAIYLTMGLSRGNIDPIDWVAGKLVPKGAQFTWFNAAAVRNSLYILAGAAGILVGVLAIRNQSMCK